MNDPVYFAEKILNINLHEGQPRWISNSNHNENLLVTGNRWGKSFVSAVKILHRAIFRIRKIEFDRCRKYRIVTASITQDQANIIFNQTVRLARESKILEPLILTITRSPFPKMMFSNGAVIEARTTQNRGEYLLGNDYDLFVFDEIAFEPHPEYIVEEVIKMRLADREGMLDLVSTPNGKNWFYKRANEILSCQRKGYFQSGDSRENKFISKDALEERLQNFTDYRIQQNIQGKFVDSGGEILKGEYIDRAIKGDSDSIITEPEISEIRYISGWDLARKKTATVGITVKMENDKIYIVKLERFRLLDWNIIIQKIKNRQIEFPGMLVIDSTGLGDVITEQLNDFKPTSVIFTQKTKSELLTNVELLHAQNKIFYKDYILPDGPGKIWSFVDELRSAKWDNNNECDSLMALALSVWPLYKKNDIFLKPRTAKIKA